MRPCKETSHYIKNTEFEFFLKAKLIETIRRLGLITIDEKYSENLNYWKRFVRNMDNE